MQSFLPAPWQLNGYGLNPLSADVGIQA